MTNLDLLKWILQTPATIWALACFLAVTLFFGIYIGWSVKFISTHWEMVAYPEFRSHKDDVAERLDHLQSSLEEFKGDVFKVLAMRRSKEDS